MAKEIISEQYDIKVVDTKLLKPYINNPRQQNKASIDKVKKSIEQNQFSSVIVVDKNYEIIAGHTRLAAALELGIKDLPVFVAKNLDEEAVKRLRVLDNRLTETTPWDLEKLVEEITPLQLDDDFAKMFDDLLAQDLDDYDFTDDTYQPVEENEPEFAEAIIQYIMIFDDNLQQQGWHSFLKVLKDKYPDEKTHLTHAARVNQHIADFMKS